MSFLRIGTLISIFALSACGFHLRGMGEIDRPLPYQSWQISQTQELEEYLHDELKRHSVEVAHSNKASHAAEILLIQMEKNRDVGSLSRIGTVSEYIFSLKVGVEVKLHGNQIGKPIFVSLQRRQSYSDNDLFGKRLEEEALWQDMYQDAAVQIVRQLPYLNDNN